MIEEMIEKCGFTVSRSRRGAYWDLVFFVRFAGPIGMRDVHYTNLSKTEMLDVIYAHLEDYAPGTVRVDGGDQHVLWMGDEGA